VNYWRVDIKSKVECDTDMANHRKAELPIIGWREWVGLPDLDIKAIKVKVDTGARSSSLHAFGLKQFERDGVQWVRFQIQPFQRKRDKMPPVEVQVLEYRMVRSSSGKAELRPVIMTNIELLGTMWPVELTLTRRTKMGFRMLLGREAIRRRFVVDAGKSYYGKRKKAKSRKRTAKTDQTDPA
jgi:hypothetical protein